MQQRQICQKKTKLKSLNFELRKIDETWNYFVDEIGQRNIMSKKHKIVCTALNYIDHLTIFVFAVS